MQLDALEEHRNSLPHADAHGGDGVTRFGALQLASGGEHKTRAAHAERMAERDAPPLGFTFSLSSGRLNARETARACAAKASLSSRIFMFSIESFVR